MLDITDLTTATASAACSGWRSRRRRRLAYVNYTDIDGNTVIAEHPVDADGTFGAGDNGPHACCRSSSRTPTTTAATSRSAPTGYLYIGMGDGGSGGDPERRATDLGDAARQDAAHRPGHRATASPTPSRRTTRSSATGAAPEIWAIGLRNPWRFSFDRETGDLWIADVGQNAIEEIDVAPATGGVDAGKGLSFGWSAFEGDARFNEDVDRRGSRAADLHVHPRRGCSVSGGVRARGPAPGRSTAGTSTATTAPARSGRWRSPAPGDDSPAGGSPSTGRSPRPRSSTARTARSTSSPSDGPGLPPRRLRRRLVSRPSAPVRAATSTASAAPGPRRRGRRGARRPGPARPGRRAGRGRRGGPRRRRRRRTLADAPGEQHRLGQVDHALSTRLARLARRHGLFGSVERRLHVVGTGRPLATASAASTTYRSARRRSGAVAWAYVAAIAGATAGTVGVRLVRGAAAGPPHGEEEGRRRGSSAGSVRWNSAATESPATSARGLAAVAQPRAIAVGGLGHHPEQAGAGGVERVGDGEVRRQRHAGVAVLARQAGRMRRTPTAVDVSSSCSGNSTARRLAPSSAARCARQLGEPGGRSSSPTVS